MKTYHGYRTEEGHAILFRRRDGGLTEPIDTDRLARRLCPWLVGGPEWGYAGSGPALLALMLCLDATGDPEMSLRTYPGLMWSRVRGWLTRGWEITDDAICAFCQAVDEELLRDTRYMVTDQVPPEGGG